MMANHDGVFPDMWDALQSDQFVDVMKVLYIFFVLALSNYGSGLLLLFLLWDALQSDQFVDIIKV